MEPGIDALLHVSQISREHIEKPSDVLKVGDEVTAKIVDFNPDSQKISLSIKALKADEEKAKREKEDSEDAVTVDIDAMIASQKNEQ